MLQPQDLAALVPGIIARETADAESYPTETMAEIFSAGLIAAPLRAEDGGSGWNLVQTTEAVELIARASGSAGLIIAMPLGISGIYGVNPDLIPEPHRAEWRRQVKAYASDVSQGRLYAAVNSEKGAGGSLAAITTTATRSADRAFHLTGDKILGTGGKFAHTFFSSAKVSQEDLPGAGIVEFFLLDSSAAGVTVKQDWDGFGMRSTESQSVRYDSAAARGVLGYPDFLGHFQPLPLWLTLFAAVPLGCAGAVITELGKNTPASPSLRLHLSEALMRYEAARGYLLQVASEFRPGGGGAYAARVARAKTYVAREMTKLSAELFAFGGGSQYRRTGRAARAFADAFAGTALRPPLVLALDTMLENFTLGDLAPQ
jgi:alkylation response protein AidB-like acyl-CoA dehydrogenase